jgi:hypothetical protein
MDRSLKFSYDFQCCDVREGDFLYQLFFSINMDRLHDHIVANHESYPLIDVDVEDYYSGSFLEESLDIDKENLGHVDMSIPIILGEISPDLFEYGMHPKRKCHLQQGYNILDRHHQLIKAHQLGMKTIQAYIVHMEQFLPFITDPDGYERYIAYWNEKITQYDESLACYRPISKWEGETTQTFFDDDPSLPQC